MILLQILLMAEQKVNTAITVSTAKANSNPLISVPFLKVYNILFPRDTITS